MSYKGATPSSGASVSPAIVSFFEKFYAVSDDPEAHEAYVGSLTSTATLTMGTRTAQGADAILSLRKSLWTGPIVRRRHMLHKIFPFSDHEVMIYGDVEYGLRNGKTVNVEWAGRAVFDQGGAAGGLKMASYQVYLDSAVVANAVKDD